MIGFCIQLTAVLNDVFFNCLNYKLSYFKVGHPAVLSYNRLSKAKCKAIPVQPWTGPEGSRKLRFPDFKTIGS
jgi:hypothetical protein